MMMLSEAFCESTAAQSDLNQVNHQPAEDVPPPRPENIFWLHLIESEHTECACISLRSSSCFPWQ